MLAKKMREFQKPLDGLTCKIDDMKEIYNVPSNWFDFQSFLRYACICCKSHFSGVNILYGYTG